MTSLLGIDLSAQCGASLRFLTLTLKVNIMSAQNQTLVSATTTTTKETTMSRTVPTGTIEQLNAALPNEVIQKGLSFFDPLDTLDETMGHQAELSSRVLDSMVWMMDTSCINQAKTILFNRFKNQQEEDALPFADFCQLVAEDIQHPSLYEEEGDESTLAILLSLQQQWHDAAATAAARDDRDFNPKNLREQMESEKVKPADIGTRSNFKKIADLEANGDAAKAERLYKAYMEADELATTNRVESNKKLIPVVLEILRAAAGFINYTARFDELPVAKQKQLTVFTIGAIERSRTDLARRLARQPLTFGRVAEAAHDAQRELEKVVAVKFTDVGELENVRSQVSIDHEREQKRRSLIG